MRLNPKKVKNQPVRPHNNTRTPCSTHSLMSRERQAGKFLENLIGSVGLYWNNFTILTTVGDL